MTCGFISASRCVPNIGFKVRINVSGEGGELRGVAVFAGAGYGALCEVAAIVDAIAARRTLACETQPAGMCGSAHRHARLCPVVPIPVLQGLFNQKSEPARFRCTT